MPPTLYRWPTDPPGKAPSHTISYQQHKANAAQQGAKDTAKGALVNEKVAPAGYTPGQIDTITKLTQGGTTFPTIQPGAAPTAPAPAPPPVDPVLEGLIAGIFSGRDTKVGQLEAQRPQVLADYGYKASGYDPATGAPVGLEFDANNPFSRAALLLRNYNQQQTGTKNSMAARGQLFSGAFQRGKRENEFGYQRGDDALKKALTASLTGIAGGIATTKANADIDAGQARLNRAPGQ